MKILKSLVMSLAYIYAFILVMVLGLFAITHMLLYILG